MLSAVLAIAVIGADPTGYAADVKLANAEFSAMGLTDRVWIRYLSLHAVPEELDAADVLAFWLPHLSAKAVLERQVPIRLGETKLYRIDLRGLGWTSYSWLKVVSRYPYSDSLNPLIIRGDWLIRETADAQESPAYYDLLYGFTYSKRSRRYKSNAPSNRAEFLKFWRVNLKDSKGLEQAIIIDEGESGVSRRTRTAIRRRTVTGHFWETLDSELGVGANDALAQITTGGKIKFDASELITSIFKISTTTGRRSNAQAYLLTDGAGKRINEASTRIVIDTTGAIPNIVTPGSCVRCHSVGILEPPENTVRAVVKGGVELFAKGIDRAEAVERLYLGLIKPEVIEDQGRFSAFVASVTEKEPEEITSAYAKLLSWYDSSLTLEQAAIETNSTPEELKLAIAYFSERVKAQTPTRLATLTIGRKVPRNIWELQTYFEALAALTLWRTNK